MVFRKPLGGGWRRAATPCIQGLNYALCSRMVFRKRLREVCAEEDPSCMIVGVLPYVYTHMCVDLPNQLFRSPLVVAYVMASPEFSTTAAIIQSCVYAVVLSYD